MSALEDDDQVAVKKEASCADSDEKSSGTVQTSKHSSSPPKEEKHKGSEMELFYSPTLEQMLMSPPFSLSSGTTASVLSSLAEAPPSGQELADILPTSFLSQLTGHLPEGASTATFPYLSLGLHSSPSDTLPHTPLVLSQQTSAGVGH